MPLLVLHFDPDGPLVDLLACPSTPHLRKINPVANSNWPFAATFLVDTGSPQSLIDETIVSRFGLHPTNAIAIAGAASGGLQVKRDCFDLSLELFTAGRVPPSYRLDLIEVISVDSRTFTGRYRGVIGRDVLDRGVFVYDARAKTCSLVDRND